MRLRCGCDPELPPSPETRCLEAQHLRERMEEAGGQSTLAGHPFIVRLGWHWTSEGQAECFAYQQRRAA
jgi:hypothetical protein